MKKIKLFTFIIFLALASSTLAQVASPLQPGHYVPGIIGIRDAITPPPGLFVVAYNWFTWGNTFIDKDGNEINKLPGLDVEPRVSGYALAPVIAWVQNFPLLGKETMFIAGISPNYVVGDYRISAELQNDGPSLGGAVIEGEVSGWSDLFVIPFGLSFAFGEFGDTGMFSEYLLPDEKMKALGLPPQRMFNLTFLYAFAAPTGRYETGATDNIGLGFWTHLFQGFGYYHPWAGQATALMLGATLELNSSIKDRDVTPGSRLSLEYGVSQFFDTWIELQFGLQHNWQLSDDTGSDVFWDPSVHDQKSSAFVSLAFMPWFARFYIVAKYGWEFGIKQRFKNDNFVLNLYYATNLLTNVRPEGM